MFHTTKPILPFEPVKKSTFVTASSIMLYYSVVFKSQEKLFLFLISDWVL
jgi:hypothetical protein